MRPCAESTAHRTLVTAIALATICTAAACEEEPVSPFRVSVAAPAEPVPAGGEFVVKVTLAISANHHVYKESLFIEAAEGSQAEVVGLDLPAGEKIEGVEEYTGATELTVRLRAKAGIPEGAARARLVLGLQGCKGPKCFLPETRELDFEFTVSGVVVTPLAEEIAAGDEAGAAFAGRGFILRLLLAFVAGLGISLTPCIYPMIPITLSIIGSRKSAKGIKSAFLLTLAYGLGISTTYAALGIAAALGGGVFGAAGQSPVALAVVGLLFLVLAMSMLGVFEIALPASFQSKVLSGGRGGAIGVFLMGLVAGLIVAPCAAPVLVGLLAYVGRRQNVFEGFLLLFVFAWGMQAVLLAVGTFGGAMPKAGIWMKRVKTVMGVVMVVAACYFVRNVVPTWVFSFVSAGACLVAALLLKGYKGPAEELQPLARKLARAGGVALFVVAAWLLIGTLHLRGATIPVLTYLGPDAAEGRDVEAALEKAKQAGKPVMLDFYTPNCVACKEIDARMLSDERLAQEARRFVIVKVNAADPGSAELVSRYEVRAVPTFVFLGSSAHELQRKLVGAVESDELLEAMRSAK